MIYDFHTHSTLSDGVLTPLELIRRAYVRGYKAIAITDHAGPGELHRIISEVARDCELATNYWDIIAIPGVELTHVPARAINDVARTAKELGARLVIVHGETPAEPVEPGTNLAAVSSPFVDILAHPGFLKPEEARIAAARGVFIELSARRKYAALNGYLARTAAEAGAPLLLNSDAHEEDDLLSPSLSREILAGAGLSEEQIIRVLEQNPRLLLSKLGL